MALKNLYDMVKADRYTADGREAIIKAQEAETEDKVYQIGEISQKTGLQKTANGWVKPKNGKQPGAKKEEPKNVHGAEVDKIYERQLKRIKELKAKGFTDEQIDNDKIIKQTKEDMKNVGKKPESKPAAEKWSKTKDYLDRERISMKTPQGGMVSIYETDNPGQKNNRFRVDTGSHANYFNTMEEAKAFAEKHYGEGSESKPAKSKPQPVSPINKEKLLDSLSFDLVDTTSDIEEEYNAVEHSDNSRLPEFVRQQVENEYVNKTNGEKWSDAEKDIIAEEVTRRIKERQSNDSAPSLSEIVDRVYNIGEISEKTGLQKTAQGWRPPQETKFGKVKQNKEGQWGVQVKQGKGSDFLKHKSEAEAKRALSNYTAGYNTTARSKEDPHSDKARQVKQWRKEDEKAAKARRAEGRAAHAAQFQKPTAGNNLPDIPDFKGMESGDYDKKLRAEGWTTGGWEGNGTHASAIFKKGDRTIRVNEGQPGKITSVQEISKAAAQDAAPRILTGDTRIRVRKA